MNKKVLLTEADINLIKEAFTGWKKEGYYSYEEWSLNLSDEEFGKPFIALGKKLNLTLW